VLDPLGMVDTHLTLPSAKVPRLMSTYTAAPAGRSGVPAPPGSPGRRELVVQPEICAWDAPTKAPSGGVGLLGTTTDYHRFLRMLASGGTLEGARVLSRRTVELMTQNVLPAHLLPINDEPLHPRGGFGLGVAVVGDYRPVIGHAQAAIGAYHWGGATNTFFWVDPREDLVGLLMTQILPAWECGIEMAFVTGMYASLPDADRPAPASAAP
jgi:CubicO group peptidase (beta-lactamase class C family)